MTLSQEERDALRRLASAIKPHTLEWFRDVEAVYECIRDEPADAEFIVAASPTKILALLDDHARLTVALQAVTEDAERLAEIRNLLHVNGRNVSMLAQGRCYERIYDICARLPTEDTKR